MKTLIVKENGRTAKLILKGNKFFSGEILWDSSKEKDPFPTALIGKERYLKLSNGKLVVDMVAKSISDAELQTKSDKNNAIASRLSDFKNFNGSSTGSGAILLKLLEHLNLK